IAFSWHLKMSSVIGPPAAMRASECIGKIWLHFVQSVTFSTLPRAFSGLLQSWKLLPSIVQQALTRSFGLLAASFSAGDLLDLSLAIAVIHASSAATPSVTADLKSVPAAGFGAYVGP